MIEVDSKKELQKFFDEVENFIEEIESKEPEKDYDIHIAGEISITPRGQGYAQNPKQL